LRETNISIGLVGRPCTGDIQVASTSEKTISFQHRLDDNRKGSYNPVVALKELVWGSSAKFCYKSNSCSVLICSFCFLLKEASMLITDALLLF
jgi:hypothetical protein